MCLSPVPTILRPLPPLLLSALKAACPDHAVTAAATCPGAAPDASHHSTDRPPSSPLPAPRLLPRQACTPSALLLELHGPQQLLYAVSVPSGLCFPLFALWVDFTVVLGLYSNCFLLDSLGVFFLLYILNPNPYFLMFRHISRSQMGKLTNPKS